MPRFCGPQLLDPHQIQLEALTQGTAQKAAFAVVFKVYLVGCMMAFMILGTSLLLQKLADVIGWCGVCMYDQLQIG